MSRTLKPRSLIYISMMGGLILSSTYHWILPPCHASSFYEAHSHTGKLPPFTPGDPKVSLDKAALAILSSGKPYQTQIKSGSSGRGLVIQDIKAPTFIVWNKILDLDHYTQMVPKTIESKNYDVVKLKSTTSSTKQKDPSPSQIIFTRMKIGFSIVSLEFFIRHLYFPSLHSLTWTLDYTKKSDLDDSVGYWYVIPHPDYPQIWSRVYYSVQVALFDWVPKFVIDFMSSMALTDATAWVKKYSELQYEQDTDHSKKKSLDGIVDISLIQGNNQDDGRDIGWKFWRNTKEVRPIIMEKIKEVGVKEQEPPKNQILISWTRMTLISVVSALATFNIHLWLSK